MNRFLWAVLPALLALPGLSTAMEALDDRELGEVSGAGVGFFLDNFYYDQGSASAQVSGLKDSQGNALTIDLERAYIKGEGSQRACNRFTRGRVSRKLHHHSNSSFRIAYLRWRHIAAYRLNRT